MRVYGWRPMIADAVPLVALVAVLAYALLSAAPPAQVVEYRIPLQSETIWEDWTVTVPRVPGARWASVDLELTAAGELGFENKSIVIGLKPIGFLHSMEQPSVSIAGQVVHREPYALWFVTPGVSNVYDGVVDYAGPSGTTASGSTQSYGVPSEVDAALFRGTGTVEVEIVAPADTTGSGHVGGAWFNLSHAVRVGGELVVRIGT